MKLAGHSAKNFLKNFSDLTFLSRNPIAIMNLQVSPSVLESAYEQETVEKYEKCLNRF
jgi:hypothetical protein